MLEIRYNSVWIVGGVAWWWCDQSRGGVWNHLLFPPTSYKTLSFSISIYSSRCSCYILLPDWANWSSGGSERSCFKEVERFQQHTNDTHSHHHDDHWSLIRDAWLVLVVVAVSQSIPGTWGAMMVVVLQVFPLIAIIITMIVIIIVTRL